MILYTSGEANSLLSVRGSFGGAAAGNDAYIVQVVLCRYCTCSITMHAFIEICLWLGTAVHYTQANESAFIHSGGSAVLPERVLAKLRHNDVTCLSLINTSPAVGCCWSTIRHVVLPVRPRNAARDAKKKCPPLKGPRLRALLGSIKIRPHLEILG
jgi:hypothetical protein